MSRRTLVLAVLLALTCVVPTVAQPGDYTQTFSGTTAGGGPTWRRPDDVGTLSNNCTACRYSVQSIALQANSTCYLVSQQDYDGHVALYRNGFNPGSPLTNLVALDDDGFLSIGTARLPAPFDEYTLQLDAGTYFLVTSGFDNLDQGSFTNTLHCESVQPVQGSCFFNGVARESQVCFFDRFAVYIDNISNHPGNGIATPVRFGSQESAFFWFYGDQNFEVMIKVLNGCALNGKYWVFAGALTNQQYRIRVGDAQTQVIKNYTNTLGTNAAAITDTNAFACVP